MPAGPARSRLDQLLVERGLAESRSRARALIEGGLVSSGGRPLSKPGQLVASAAPLELRGLDHPWVSRAGIKLAFALERFTIDARQAVALDLGASTGGFTEVLLAHGARRVYAVEVGHGQLTPKLRADPRVVLLERTNARSLTREQVPEPPSLIVSDVSFIGLETVLPAPLALAAPGAVLVALVKPQFEVGPGRIGKGGVVRDQRLHDEVCRRIVLWLESRMGWRVEGLAESPVLGGDGNREFLLNARLPP